jgi:hypothetical protein
LPVNVLTKVSIPPQRRKTKGAKTLEPKLMPEPKQLRTKATRQVEAPKRQRMTPRRNTSPTHRTTHPTARPKAEEWRCPRRGLHGQWASPRGERETRHRPLETCYFKGSGLGHRTVIVEPSRRCRHGAMAEPRLPDEPVTSAERATHTHPHTHTHYTPALHSPGQHIEFATAFR